jgi:hypothetical protein
LLIELKLGVELVDWKPKWEEVVEFSRELVQEYVARIGDRPKRGGSAQSYMVQDQLRLFNQGALLYVATTRASKHGDIRRMEDLLV